MARARGPRRGLAALAALLGGRAAGAAAANGTEADAATAEVEGAGAWHLAGDGQACDTACARLGKHCSEAHWPETPGAMRTIASGLGHECEDMQSGDVGYDPSLDGTYCGWRANMGVPRAGHETRCAALPPWSTRRFCFCTGVLDTTTVPFNCLEGLGDDQGDSWSGTKRQWCCQWQGLGCTTTSAPFDCDAGFDNWQRGWSKNKKVWCCRARSRGCETTTATVTRTTTRALFDCGTGYANWVKGWSDSKKDWCCRFRSLGCTTVTSSTTSASPRFDCGRGDGPWSAEKRDWCCEDQGIGCPIPSASGGEGEEVSFDCSAGYTNWRAGWSDSKKDWCCGNKGLGCTFNCVAGYSNWRTGWSYAKKAWCCQHQKLGCIQ